MLDSNFSDYQTAWAPAHLLHLFNCFLQPPGHLSCSIDGEFQSPCSREFLSLLYTKTITQRNETWGGYISFKKQMYTLSACFTVLLLHYRQQPKCLLYTELLVWPCSSRFSSTHRVSTSSWTIWNHVLMQPALNQCLFLEVVLSKENPGEIGLWEQRSISKEVFLKVCDDSDLIVCLLTG